MMEQYIAMGKGKKLKESRGQKMDEDFNTDRDIFKGHSTFYMFKEDDELDNLFNNISTMMTRGLTLPKEPLPTSSGRQAASSGKM